MRFRWRANVWKKLGRNPMVNDSPIELVCFDLGGVLVRICHSWAEAAERAGVPNLMKFDDQAVPQAVLPALCAYEVGRMDTQTFAARLADLSDGHTPEHIHAIIEAWLIEMYDGVDDLLVELAESGLATACLSNTNQRHWQMMAQRPGYEPMGRLTHKFASHLARCRKPDRGIYEYLETHAAVAPQRIVFFDDVPANIAAAESRGWQGCLIDPHADPVAQMRRHLGQVV